MEPADFATDEAYVLYQIVRHPNGGEHGDVSHVFAMYHFVQFHVARYPHLSASLADEYDELQRTSYCAPSARASRPITGTIASRR
jgi:hypothetical protein